jgi:Phosphoinositide phospholipase C, Ca2+-dependent
VSADLRAVHQRPVPRLTRHYSDAILTDGWPTLRAARGKVMFLMDGGHYRTDYVPATKRPDGPVRFTKVTPGRPDAAFVKRDDPLRPNTAAIQVGVAGEAAGTVRQVLSESSELSPGLVSPEPEHLGYRGFVLFVPEGRWRTWNGKVALIPALRPQQCSGLSARPATRGMAHFARGATRTRPKR